MRKKLAMGALGIALLGATTFGAVSTFAQEDGNDNVSTLVQKIAQKFNLNQADVQAVFNEHKSEKIAQMDVKHEERLTQLVTEGKITEAQKQLILAKHKQLRSQMETNLDEFKNLTPEERHSKMEAKKVELETWAKDNGIDLQYLMPKFGVGFHGHHGFWMKDTNSQSSPSPNPAQ